MREGALRIGEVARRAGVSTRTIRFYEAAGVLPPAVRSPSGYRRYGLDAVARLRFVRQAQELGLSLGEIREIVAIRRGGRSPCGHVYRLLQGKAAELDRKLRDLQALRRRLRRSLAAWGQRPGPPAVVCPHIEAGAGRLRRKRKRPSARGLATA